MVAWPVVVATCAVVADKANQRQPMCHRAARVSLLQGAYFLAEDGPITAASIQTFVDAWKSGLHAMCNM